MKEEYFLKSHNLDTHTHTTGEIRKLHTRPIGHQNESDGPKTKSFFCEFLRKKWRIPFRSSPNLRWEKKTRNHALDQEKQKETCFRPRKRPRGKKEGNRKRKLLLNIYLILSVGNPYNPFWGPRAP